VSRSFGVELSGRPCYTVQTLGQPTLSSTQSWISNDTIWEGSARRPDDVATHPNPTQCSRIFQVSFTNAERSDSLDCWDAQSSCTDAVWLWEELSYFGKTVAEDQSDAAK
jgi:hypothetical protein